MPARILFLLVGCCLISACNRQKPVEVARPTPTPPPSASVSVAPVDSEAARRDLQAVGQKVATAILNKDTDPILSFSRNSGDTKSLTEKNGELYCYLFETSCLPPERKSVYDILSTAHDLAIDASVTKSSANGKLYGLLLFYDKSQVSEQMLSSSAFQCSDESFKKVASWHFTLEGRKWQNSTLFDYGTEGICNEDD
jgi:hypothetical protein